VEATTGWRYVVEELRRAGIEAHLAEPADTKALRGRKKRAKTDRLDARHLRELLVIGRLPESWILRTLMRMRHSMIEERTAHLQRIHAQLFHEGYPQQKNPLSAERRERLGSLDLSNAARKVVDLALKMIDHINEELAPIEAELRTYARSQGGCRALMGHYGVGELTSVALFSELGDTRRFSSSKKAVRFAGLDVTVHNSSDDKRAAGKLSRQGSPVLRWAAYEAAKGAWRKGSPDHEYYLRTKERIGGNRAALSVARKLIRRAHHALRELGEEAMSEPVAANSSV
jgi:transposase